jgi:hypothetical protein
VQGAHQGMKKKKKKEEEEEELGKHIKKWQLLYFKQSCQVCLKTNMLCYFF